MDGHHWIPRDGRAAARLQPRGHERCRRFTRFGRKGGRRLAREAARRRQRQRGGLPLQLSLGHPKRALLRIQRPLQFRQERVLGRRRLTRHHRRRAGPRNAAVDCQVESRQGLLGIPGLLRLDAGAVRADPGRANLGRAKGRRRREGRRGGRLHSRCRGGEEAGAGAGERSLSARDADARDGAAASHAPQRARAVKELINSRRTFYTTHSVTS
mmetsp:Transcript_14140/g.35928  ORF Transcript_14140/g.35928 Transcript_14140/m.35928 type:complete len:213 (+) Transcript_14140:2288-2926(+)